MSPTQREGPGGQYCVKNNATVVLTVENVYGPIRGGHIAHCSEEHDDE
jgi:hypothetical protein